MSQQDYFSYTSERPTGERRKTQPARIERKTSTAHNTAMREIIKPWAEMPATPPSCRTVSFSRWSNFTTSGTTTPTGELKASKLCANYGTTHTYSPPAGEWAYLGAEQPLRCGKPVVQRSRHRRQQSPGTCPSLSSTTSTTSSGSQTEPMNFRRQRLKRVSTSSQLTESFKASPGRGGQEHPPGMQGLISRLGLDALGCEELPSAFDSDDEDGIVMEDLRAGTSVAGSRDGARRRGEGDQVTLR